MNFGEIWRLIEANVKGKIALVTGASKGIGNAVAKLLAQNGATVVMTARNANALQKAAADINESVGQAMAISGDITDEAFVEKLFRTIDERYKRLDILINNAGVAPFGRIQDLPVKKLRECLETNIVAVFMCMQQAIRVMERNGGVGKIINIGSVRSHWTEGGDSGAYNASKSGVLAMTESVARQLHGTGSRISVGIVCPGIVDTTLTNPKGEPHPDWLAPETVAQAVLHAVSAPDGVNIFDITLFPTAQKPW